MIIELQRFIVQFFQCGKSAKRSHIEALLEPASLNLVEKIGDWFLLQLIVKNLDTLTVNDVILLLYLDQERIKKGSKLDNLTVNDVMLLLDLEQERIKKESKESNADTENVKPPETSVTIDAK